MSLGLYQGTYTALVTPFREDRVDEAALSHLLEAQIAAGISGVVPVGTTGESATLSMEEHLRVLNLTVQIVQKRIKVWAGTGSNSTSEALFLSRQAEKSGADGLLVVTPYYNKPSQAGLFAHYSALAEAVPLPLITYSVPGRTGMEIGLETMAQLAARHKNIVAIKEAGGSIERFSQLRNILPDDFVILSGDDSMTLPALAVGATGVISVASNLIPAEIASLVRHYLAGETGPAAALHRKFYPLFRDLFIEANPVPVKTALAHGGWMTDEVRLPLAPLSATNRTYLEGLLKAYGL